MRFFFGKNLPAAKHGWQRANIYAGLRAPQTPRARLAAWTASQNCVLLFQPVFADTLLSGASRPVTFRHTHPFYRPHNLSPSSRLHSGLAGQQSHASHLSLQSKSQPPGSQRPPIFRQSPQTKQQTNLQKQPQKTTKKGSRSFLRKNYCKNLSTAAT